MTEDLAAGLDYLDRWLGFQMRASQRPGCAIAVVQDGAVVLERAYGFADLEGQVPLTPRHRMRAASHTKSFTAAGILKLREAGKIGLDDPVGDYVKGLHPDVAQASIEQLLSHSAGLTRDGVDDGQFDGRRSFLSAEELMAELSVPPAIEASTRFKYSTTATGCLAWSSRQSPANPTRPGWSARPSRLPGSPKATSTAHQGWTCRWRSAIPASCCWASG